MDREDMLRSPRMARKVAATLLEIEEKDISYGAFRAWLGRYKKKEGRKTAIKSKASAVRKSSKKKCIPDWRDFKPTELVIKDHDPANDEPLLKRIDYQSKNKRFD